MQPETLCNLDCAYCYLPFRHQRNTMSVAVAQAVADSIRVWTESVTVDVCWHGGEPLTTGRAHLGRLMDCFAGLDVKHGVQTNATLIDDAWCEFFSDRNMYVGISIDGDSADNGNRVYRRGSPAHQKIVRGIRCLVDHGHDVHAIAVVSNPSPERARRLFRFAADIGISVLGVNIEEKEGVNIAANAHDRAVVVEFWRELMSAWTENPVVRLRELERTLSYIDAVLESSGSRCNRTPLIDPLPTIAYDGSVTLISPELAGFSTRKGGFSSGNVLDTPLGEIVAQAGAVPWIAEFTRGVNECRATCPYFEFCGGGHPANRYFEHGRMDGTKTNYCQNGRMALMEGVLQLVEPDVAC